MGLLDRLFGRTPPDTSPRPAAPAPPIRSTPVAPAGPRAEASPARPGPGMAATQPGRTKALRMELRTAVEVGDLRAAGRLGGLLERARAAERGRDVPAETHDVDAPPSLRELTGAGLSADRIEQVRTEHLLNGVGVGLNKAGPTVTACLGVPLEALAAWPRFTRDRKAFRAADYTPAMWKAELLIDPDGDWAGPQTAALASLSADARIVLGRVPTAIRSRPALSRTEIAEKTFLPPERLHAAMDELTAAGLAAPVTLADQLGRLTLDQLRGLAQAGGADDAVAAAGKRKAAAVEALLRALDPAALPALIAGQDPAVAATEVSVGIGAGKDAGWFLAFCDLLGHWVTMSTYTARDKRSRVPVGGRRELLRTDDCPVCAAAPTRIADGQWPPLHLGCRCSTVVDFD